MSAQRQLIEEPASCRHTLCPLASQYFFARSISASSSLCSSTFPSRTSLSIYEWSPARKKCIDGTSQFPQHLVRRELLRHTPSDLDLRAWRGRETLSKDRPFP